MAQPNTMPLLPALNPACPENLVGMMVVIQFVLLALTHRGRRQARAEPPKKYHNVVPEGAESGNTRF